MPDLRSCPVSLSRRARIAPLVVALLFLSLAACGGHKPASEIGFVIPATCVTASEAAKKSAASVADWKRKILAPYSWTYARAGGQLDLPADFKGACEELHQAWSAAARVFPDDMGFAVFLRSRAADRRVALDHLDPEHQAKALALRAIDAAYAKVARLAHAYGAAAPTNWLTD